jgi:hypothetical protein
MKQISTEFCSCCSLQSKKIPDDKKCNGSLYLGLPFFDFEAFMKQNYRTSPDKRCDVLYHKNEKLVFIELKALNWFLKDKPKEKELKTEIEELRKKLVKKFLDSIKNFADYTDISKANIPYCIVAFSKDVIRWPALQDYDTTWLKWYLQQRLFPFMYALHCENRDIPVIIRPCDKLQQMF